MTCIERVVLIWNVKVTNEVESNYNKNVIKTWKKKVIEVTPITNSHIKNIETEESKRK